MGVKVWREVVLVMLSLQLVSGQKKSLVGWFKNETILCTEPTTISGEPCSLVWLNPLTPIKMEIMRRDPVMLYFPRLFPYSVGLKVMEESQPYMKPALVQVSYNRQRTTPRRQGYKAFVPRNLTVVSQLRAITEPLARLQMKTGTVGTLLYFDKGHFAPHIDSSYADPKTAWSKLWLCTFLIYWHFPPHSGTVFPHIRSVTNPTYPGDAFFHYNVHTDGTKIDESFHGGCPVYDDFKLATTMHFHMYHWDKEKYQQGMSCSKNNLKYHEPYWFPPFS